MDIRRLEAINKEVNALLNEPLEDIWKENNTYPSLISPGEVPKPSSKETLPLGSQVTVKSLHSNSLLSVEPSLATFLSALSEPSSSFKSSKERTDFWFSE
jgi:hypothetical protein